jgi:hypothetical protein
VLIVGAAFAVAYAVVSLTLGDRQGGARPADPTAPTASGAATAQPEVPRANPDEAPPQVPAASSPAQSTMEAPTPGFPRMEVQSDLDFPPDIEVKEYRKLGLLEVRTDADVLVYVDDVSVGRGPLRRVPLEARTHSVRLLRDGQELSRDVTVQVGRLTVFSPAVVQPQ